MTFAAKVRPDRAQNAMGPELSAENYLFLQDFVRKETGIILDGDKQYLLQTRLLPVLSSEIAKELNVNSVDGLIQRLAAGKSDALAQMVLDGVTTNETFFFRDEPVFEALRKEILPDLFQSLGRRRRLRIWSAASSTGQEAYSLAMLLQEMGKSAADVEIVGTDISGHALAKATEAVYLPFEVGRGLPKPYLKRYFLRCGNDWQLRDDVRSMVRFERADIRRNLAKLGVFDLVLCRNVLIYFDVDTKKQIIRSLEPMLQRSGVLVLGCAETLINLSDGLHRKQIGKATFYSFHQD